MEIRLQEGSRVEITCVPNSFIDEYLAEASGEYVRVYLYLLRHLRENVKVHSIADALNLTDHDIKRAIFYWEKRGIFPEGTTEEVEQEIRSEEAARLSEEDFDRKQAKHFTKPSFYDEAVQEGTTFSEEEFEGVLYVAKHLLPGGVTRSHIQKFEYMMGNLKMDAELVEFLLDYCASIEKTAPRYMESVALNWHEQGIKTVKEARELIQNFQLTKKAQKSALQSRAQGIKNGQALDEKPLFNGRKEEKKSNRFVNFTQEEVDYDSLAKEKAMNLLQQGGTKEWR